MLLVLLTTVQFVQEQLIARPAQEQMLITSQTLLLQPLENIAKPALQNPCVPLVTSLENA